MCIFVYITVRWAYGLGRVRSSARTHFLTLSVTPLPPQWILGVQSAHAKVNNLQLRATLKITKTITGALPNRPDQITILSRTPPWNLMKITETSSIVTPNRPRKSSFFIRFQKTKKRIYKQKSEIINFAQGFPLFWSRWIRLWPLFSLLNFQQTNWKYTLAKPHAFQKKLHYQRNINISTFGNYY